jgi:hypothetical protein
MAAQQGGEGDLLAGGDEAGRELSVRLAVGRSVGWAAEAAEQLGEGGVGHGSGPRVGVGLLYSSAGKERDQSNKVTGSKAKKRYRAITDAAGNCARDGIGKGIVRNNRSGPR